MGPVDSGARCGARPMVRAESVRKRYRRTEVLKGVDLEVDAGDVLCLIGPSVSG
jgi:polar amino acid transport system ATP-binding protein